MHQAAGNKAPGAARSHDKATGRAHGAPTATTTTETMQAAGNKAPGAAQSLLDVSLSFSKGFPQLGEAVETELRDLERIMDEEHSQEADEFGLRDLTVCRSEAESECQPCCSMEVTPDTEVGLVYENVGCAVLSAKDVV